MVCHCLHFLHKANLLLLFEVYTCFMGQNMFHNIYCLTNVVITRYLPTNSVSLLYQLLLNQISTIVTCINVCLYMYVFDRLSTFEVKCKSREKPADHFCSH